MAPKTEGDNANSSSGFGLDVADKAATESGSKKKGKTAPKISAKGPKNKKQKKAKGKTKRADPSSIIPKVVSRRMIQRVGIFSGLPTLLAFLVIPISYFVTEQGWIDFPSTVVLLASVTFLGLGLLGVSYGIISASWDEEIKGSALGISEFQLNISRIQDRRRIQKEERKRVKEKEDKAKKEADKTTSTKSKSDKSEPTKSAKADVAHSEPQTEAHPEPQEESTDS